VVVYNDSHPEHHHQINKYINIDTDKADKLMQTVYILMLGAKAAYTSAGFEGYELDPTIGKVSISLNGIHIASIY
jgi:hypothetical protein